MDRYAKAVLTVIAAALVTIALQNAGVVPARAQERGDGIMKVQICGAGPDGAPACASLARDVSGWVGLYTFASVTR